MCQTNAAAAMKAVYSLLRYCCTCIALRVLRFATQFVTLLAAHTAFVTAALVSFTPLRSFLPPFRFITPRSQLIHLLQGWASLATPQMHRTGECTSLLQAIPTILTGFHFAALRHSFTSVAFSPPAAHNLACLAACHSYGFVMVFVRHTLSDENKNTCQTLASHCCCLSPFHGFLASTVAGARSQFQSFLLPLAFGGTPLGYSVDKCATRLCFFLAAGAITFCRHTGYN